MQRWIFIGVCTPVDSTKLMENHPGAVVFWFWGIWFKGSRFPKLSNERIWPIWELLSSAITSDWYVVTDHCHILERKRKVLVSESRLEVSDSTEIVDGNYSNSARVSCSMGNQRHTGLILPKSADVYRVLKFRLVSKRIISSILPMASCYCPEQTYLQNNTIDAAFLGISASCMWVTSWTILEAPWYSYPPAISLTGIAIVQTHLYYHQYPKDWMFQKVAVSIVASIRKVIACPRMEFSCRHGSLILWGAITFVSLQYPCVFTHGIHYPCRLLLHDHNLRKHGRHSDHRLVRVFSRSSIIPHVDCTFLRGLMLDCTRICLIYTDFRLG